MVLESMHRRGRVALRRFHCRHETDSRRPFLSRNCPGVRQATLLLWPVGMASHRLRKSLLGAGVIAFGTVIVGGPLSSGGFFLTMPTFLSREAVTLPWLEPYHRGGIDFATGIYVRNDQDMTVRGGDLPVVLQRAYNSKDRQSGAFGVGTSHNGEWYLVGDGQRFQWVQLVMAEGSRIDYGRVTWGTSVWNAMFEHTATPTLFYESRLGWTGTRWALRWYDGSVAIFRSCSPRGNDRCSIVDSAPRLLYV